MALPGAAALTETLHSIRAQTLADIECIVIGDGAEPVGAGVTLVPAPGLDTTARLNLGLMRATAPAVALIGPGCVAAAHWLETLAEFMALTGAVAVGCGHIRVAPDGTRAVIQPSEAARADPASIPPRTGGMALPFLMLDREAVLGAGGFRPSPGTEDVELTLRLAMRAPVWTLPETLGTLAAEAPTLAALRMRSVATLRILLDGGMLDPAALVEASGSLEAAVALAAARLQPEDRDRLALGTGLALVAEARRAGVAPDAADLAFARAALAERRGRLSVRDADAAVSLLRGAGAVPAPFLPATTVIDYNGVKLATEPGVLAGRLREALLGGWYELEESRHVPGLVRPGDRVLELGAGLGYVTTVLARCPEVESVVSVEANPQLARLAARTVALNGVAGKVTVHNSVALPAPTTAAVPFYVRHEFWASSLDADAAYVREITVPVLDIDALIAEHRPTLLVIDIEGGEVELLERAELGGVRRVFAELHQGPIGREGMRRVFSAMASRYFHYDQDHSEGSVVLFSRVDLDG